MHTNMGNKHSVHHDSFEEEYYMFFDNGRVSSGANTNRTNPSFGGEDTTKSLKLGGPSPNKMVSRANPTIIYEESTKVGSMATTISDSLNSRGYDSLGDVEIISSPKRTTQCMNGVVTRDYPKTGTIVDNLYKEVWTPSGKFYQGYWRGDEMFHGRILWPDGREYQGALKNGLPHGYGVYYKTGKRAEYHGYWHEGLQHGQGVFISRKHECPVVRRGTWHLGRMLNKDGESPKSAANIKRRVLHKILYEADSETSPIHRMVPCSGDQTH